MTQHDVDLENVLSIADYRHPVVKDYPVDPVEDGEPYAAPEWMVAGAIFISIGWALMGAAVLAAWWPR